MQARLGSAVVAANGRVLAVGGSSLGEFAKNSAGQWTQTAKIVAPDAGVLTGPVVADGSTLLIRGYTPAQTSVVYSYSYDGTKWRGVGILKGSAQFGTAIALDGCSALISSTLRRDRMGGRSQQGDAGFRASFRPVQDRRLDVRQFVQLAE